MAALSLKKAFIVSFWLFFFTFSFGQLPYGIIDGRQSDKCAACASTVNERPPEVLFGIDIHANGDVFFSMNNKEWFNKIFKDDSYGITADIVSKDRYACSSSIKNNNGLPKGTMLSPVYKRWLAKGIDALSEGRIDVKIGVLPKNLMGKELEANLVIMNGRNICFYTNFIDIERSVWHLLPMGLFTDSLILADRLEDEGLKNFFIYTKQIQLEVPFAKGGSTFSDSYIKQLYDSLNLTKYAIKKLDIRAYSSVEGPEAVNNNLMKRRADAMITAIKRLQPSMNRMHVLTAENWLEFFQDIVHTNYKQLQNLSKPAIKQQLLDPTTATALEPMLAKQRKVVLTMYLETKSTESNIGSGDLILAEFQKSVAAKNVQRARAIQKELVDRILDNKLPTTYIEKLEIPQSKDFSSLLNDREVYKFLLKTTSEYEALNNFKALHKLDPTNGRINYNICSLNFFMWQYGGDSLVSKHLLKDIYNLPRLGINATLTKRMMMNYHILNCEDQMKVYNYAAKDSSLIAIRNLYKGLQFTDEDIYSLAKYFTAYSHNEWATEIIKPRIDKINASEDLIFYYVNLLFFHSDEYATDNFKKAALNAINLNRKRFCNFFLPSGQGGASMQLLDEEIIKSMYCETCR